MVFAYGERKMADVTDAELTKWFDEQYFQDNPQRRDEYDALDDAGKRVFRDKVIEDEKNRRNNENNNQNESVNQDDIVTNTITNEVEKVGYTSDEWEQIFTGDDTRFLKEK